MGRIRLTRQAEEDLVAIWGYIAEDNPVAADGLLDEIDAAMAMLSEHPAAGRPREELAPGLRSLPVGRYVIFYRPDEIGIVAIRVLHGARDLLDLL